MATIVEVAALAGVSTSTVSHVLNETRHVEPATRRRVLEAIEKTSYRQDALARAMRRSRTDSIGLVIPDAGEPAFAEMVHGVEHAAAKLGLTLLLSNSAESAERESKAVRVLLERRVDGLILARSANSSRDIVDDLRGENAAVVLLDRMSPDSPFDQVGTENRQPMRSLVSHLASAGHRRMVLVAGDMRVPTLRERADGFTIGIVEAGLDISEQTVIASDQTDTSLAEAITRAISDPRRPTAFIACSTVLAVATLERMKAAGKAIPRDFAFATFDGFSHSDLFEPSITTVRQPAFEVGVAAVDLLKDRLAGSTSLPRIVHLAQTIEYRDSTSGFKLAR